MKYMTYSKEGQPISDFGLETEFQIFKKYGGSKNYSTENIFNRIRLAIIDEEIENDIVFIFNNKQYPLNEYGQVIGKLPQNFLDVNSSISERILQRMMNKYERNRVSTNAFTINLK